MDCVLRQVSPCREALLTKCTGLAAWQNMTPNAFGLCSVNILLGVKKEKLSRCLFITDVTDVRRQEVAERKKKQLGSNQSEAASPPPPEVMNSKFQRVKREHKKPFAYKNRWVCSFKISLWDPNSSVSQQFFTKTFFWHNKCDYCCPSAPDYYITMYV